MPPRRGRQPSSMAKHDPGQRRELPRWHPPMSQHHPHGPLCPQHPRGGQGCASSCLLHPGPTLVHADVPVSHLHFWTFSACQQGCFYWGLVGDDSQFPIFASTCPGEVSWQVGSSQAGGGEPSQGSCKMLQPSFWAESPPSAWLKLRDAAGRGLGVSLLGLNCGELQPSVGCTRQTPNPFSPGGGEPGCSLLPAAEVSAGTCHLP